MTGRTVSGERPVLAIVGANGFIGRSLTQVAGDAGWQVLQIVRGTRSSTGPVRSSPDLQNEPDLQSLLQGADVCVNLAARVHIEKTGTHTEELAAHDAMNREFPIRLAEAAASAGVRRMVQLSSVAAIMSTTPPGSLVDDSWEPSPTSPYGISKLEADRALEALVSGHFTTVSLRPPAVFGPGVAAQFARLMAIARRGIPLPVGAIQNARSFAFVNNVSEAILAAAQSNESGAYIVTDSPPQSTAALYRELQRLYGHRPSTPRFPASVVQRLAALVLGERAGSLIGNAAYDGSRFGTIFRWSPGVTFEDGLRATVEADRRKPKG